jgi:hypothetical protein
MSRFSLQTLGTVTDAFRDLASMGGLGTVEYELASGETQVPLR